MSGMSKKLCITMIGIQAVVHLSQGVENPYRYAGLIAGMVIVYKIVQCRIDVIRTKFGQPDKQEKTNDKE
jgi:hypothetical protein